MIYYCADDYGMSAQSNSRIESCLKNGILNKVSVLPNGEITDFKERLSGNGAILSLHINLVEGFPLSEPDDVSMLISNSGQFKYSFIGLFFLSLSSKKREMEKQLYKEIQSQIRFWKMAVGEDTPISIDSHQHTHMIPLVCKTLMRVLDEECLNAQIRIPAEPILPYVLTPSLYFEYSPVGLIKQWLLKALAIVNHRIIKRTKIQPAYFMGIMFSGRLNEERIRKILTRYLKLAEKNNRNIEIGFHPGYVKRGEKLIDGYRREFSKFYYSPWRKIEFDTLINFKTKEGYENALP